MAELRPFEEIDSGGVDARSNPINMPRNRALRCLNWVPRQAGYWELRYGYTTAPNQIQPLNNTPITRIIPFQQWNGTKYALLIKGTVIWTLNLSTGVLTQPNFIPTSGTVLTAELTATTPGTYFVANNHLHYGNGTDQIWFDGTTWRPSGLRALTAPEISAISVSEGVREMTAGQNSSVTLTATGGGSFAADTFTGHLIYVAFFDTANNEVGPSTNFAGAGRVKLTANQEILVQGLPNLSGLNTNFVKLIGGTSDGGSLAYFFTNTSTVITTISWVSGFLFVTTSGNHGLSVGDVVIISGSGNASFNGLYSLVTASGNSFTARFRTQPASQTAAGGTVKRIVSASNTATSVTVLAPTQDNTYQVNQLLGVAASTIGGANPGYQFAVSIYMPSAGGHVGNYSFVGSRFVPTVRCTVHIDGLPAFANPYWAFLIGRTGDGGQVPYPCTDNAVNWQFWFPAGLVGGGGSGTSATFPSAAVDVNGGAIILGGNIDGNHEMPSRNGIIPPQCNLFCVAGDYAYAADTGSPVLRRSGSLADARSGAFTGIAEQSWAGDDTDSFPTGMAMTAIFEVEQEVFCGTLDDCAISVNAAGVQQWLGPWNVGIAGMTAGTKCGSHGFHWLNGEKQICTFQNGVPVVVSDEYEAAELFQIGDSFLSTVQLVYYRNAQQRKDELRVEAKLANGTPYTIIHDFTLREVFTAPGSIYGQGYSSQYAGPLATAFSVGQVRDGSGKLRVFAGGNDGQLYQLYSGADDLGNQYTADLILLVNGGTQRPSVPFIDWYGDGQIVVSKGRTLSTSLAGGEFAFEPVTPLDNPAQTVQGSENDFLYRAYFSDPEVQHTYMRFQLTSHSADGNLDLNSPPHIPLENYGRIYELIPAMGDERER